MITVPARTAVAQAEKISAAETLLDEGKAADAVRAARSAVSEFPDNARAWFVLGRALHATGDLDAAVEADAKAATFPATRAASFYNLACAYAQLGNADAAIAALDAAKRAGFADRDLMARDPDLEPVRDDPRFELPGKRVYKVLDVGDGRGLPYSIDLPVDFDPSNTYPVLVGPGAGEPIDGQFGSLFWGEDARQRGWVVVESPVLVMPGGASKLRILLDTIETEFRVEGQRFHLAGFSANSPGAFLAALEMPERFHTVSGIPGYPPDAGDQALRGLKGVVVSMIVGENDEAWLGEARAAHARLLEVGVDARLEVVPGGGHVLEQLFGGEFMDRLDRLRDREDRP